MGRKKKEPTKVMRVPVSLVSHVVGLIKDKNKKRKILTKIIKEDSKAGMYAVEK